jgi:DeoR family transcriptional regulator of aga operon
VYLDKAFISVTGFDIERGVTTLEAEEATVSLAMLRQAREVIVVADSSKIGHVSPALICPISAIHTLVTDSGVSDEVYQKLTARGIKVVRA